MRFILLLLSLFPISLSLYAEETTVQNDELTIRFQDPVYSDGVLTCDQGVLVEYPGLRIQAKKITYINKNTDDGYVHKLYASGDLLVEFNKRFYVGDTIEYDFISKTGTVTNGVTCIERVFIGGKEFYFHPDKTITVKDLYVTTSGDKDYIWNFQAATGTLDHKLVLHTEKVTFRIKDVPVFYFPSYTTKFRSTGSSPFKYNVYWESGQGPMLSARARIYSNDTLALYARGEYRIRRGFGTALESDYKSDTLNQSFKTRSFYAYDTFYNDNDPNKKASRLRFQGIYNASSDDKTLELFARWDRLTDRFMQSDFSIREFELNTLQRTEAWLRKRDEIYNASIYFRPRINGYQGFMQELPTVNLRFKPVPIGKTGIFFNNNFSGAFLDYVYSERLGDHIDGFKSGRIQMQNSLERPISTPYFTFTPKVGGNTILYTEMTDNKAGVQLLGEYGAKLESSWAKNYEKQQHLFGPYVDFYGFTSPTVKVGTAPVFSVSDGLNKINQLKFGVYNNLYSLTDPSSDPRVGIDVYGLAFFDNDIYERRVPIGITDLELNYPAISFGSRFAWNFEQNLVDMANFTAKWTVNRYYAFNVEMRHRGRYWWKKDDPTNYILNVTRPIDELLDSPVSDNRNTILTKMQLQLTPQWWCQIENHVGWGRKDQPAYNETKVDFYTIVASMWQLRLSYMKTVRASQFTFGISMLPTK